MLNQNCPTPTALEAAREWAARNQITSARAWNAQPWFNRWQTFEQFKRQLAAEVPPGSDGWRPALKQLTDVLHV